MKSIKKAFTKLGKKEKNRDSGTSTPSSNTVTPSGTLRKKTVSSADVHLPEPHEVLIRKEDITKYYEIGEVIGRGNFSVVRKGKNRHTGESFAVKAIRKKHLNSDERLKREVHVMKQAKHPHVLPLEDVFEDEDNLYIVLGYVKGGELFDRIIAKEAGYSEKDARNIIKQILEAIAYLHSRNIVHRDLKPENLLCDGDDEHIHIFVADFGFSKLLSDRQQLMTQCGSPEYMAPEIIECQPYEQGVDMWALGVITYVLLTGCFPFFHKEPAVLHEAIRKVDYVWDEDQHKVSSAAQDFVAQLLVRDPARRLTAQQALQHKWVTGEYARQSLILDESRQLLRKTSEIWKKSKMEKDN